MFKLAVLLVFAPVILCTAGEEQSVDKRNYGNPCCTACTLKMNSVEKKLDELLKLVYKSSAICPAGWTTYDTSTSCYRFVNNPVTKWQDARKACLAMGADLVKIDSLRENDYVLHLAQTYPSKYLYLWIGLYRDVNKNFMWVDGSSISGQYTRWNTGEPNNGDKQEDCAHLYLDTNHDGEWNDIRCDFSGKGVYMCEKSKQFSG